MNLDDFWAVGGEGLSIDFQMYDGTARGRMYSVDVQCNSSIVLVLQ